MKNKKIIILSFLIIFGFLFSFNPSGVKAITAEELRDRIAQIRQQIAELQQQLTEIQGQEVWCHNFNTNLRYGDTGLEVKALQTALEKEGFSISNSEKTRSYFGESTASAVVGFQKKYKEEILGPWKLEQGTGFVGSTVLKKLNELYNCGTTLDQAPTSAMVDYWAVLFVTHRNNNSVLVLRDILINNGWEEDHIKYMLSEDATRENLLTSLDWLKNNSDDNDVILFYDDSHGGPYGMELMSWADLAKGFEGIRYGGLAFVISTCYSGSAIPYLQGENRVILTASRGDEVADWEFPTQLFHALSGFGDIEGNNNGRVSIEEAFNFLKPDTENSSARPQIKDNYPGELDITFLDENFVGLDQYNVRDPVPFANYVVGSPLPECNDTYIAQSFKPNYPVLTKVMLEIDDKPSDINLGPLTVSIRKDLSGPDLTSITIEQDSFFAGFSGVFYEFDFPDIEVVPNGTYFIVIRAPNAVYEPGIYSGYSFRGCKNNYLRGKAISVGCPEYPWPSGEQDLFFATFGTTTAEITVPSITITSPNRGVFRVKKSSKITWKQTGLDGKEVDILLAGYSKDGKQIDDWKMIRTGVPIDREYIFWVPHINDSVISSFSTFPDKYKIKISETTTGVNGISDISDDYFTIDFGTCHTSSLWSWNYCSPTCKCDAGEGDCDTDADCNTGYCAQNVGSKYGQVSSMDVCEKREEEFITVISPNAEESWIKGNTYKIKWTSSGVDKVYINLEDYRDTTASVETFIAGGIPASLGEYLWTIPENISPGDYFKIVITEQDPTYPSAQDESDNYFSIVSEKLPDLTVTKLKVYRIDSDNVGMDYCIKNIGNADSGKFHLKFYNLDNPSWDFGGDDFDHLSVGEEWCGKSSRSGVGPKGGNGYVKGNNRIKIFIDSNYEVKELDESNNEIITTFNTGFITVVWPKPGERWEIGKTYDIIWTSTGVSNTVKMRIELLSPSSKRTIIWLLNNPGFYSWTVPSDIPIGDKYLIRIISYEVTGISDDSDGYFSIIESGGLGLKNIENQLADISQAISGLMEKLKSFLENR